MRGQQDGISEMQGGTDHRNGCMTHESVLKQSNSGPEERELTPVQLTSSTRSTPAATEHLGWSTNWAFPAEGVWFSKQVFWQQKPFQIIQNTATVGLGAGFQVDHIFSPWRTACERPLPSRWCVTATYAWAFTFTTCSLWVAARERWYGLK